MGWNNTREVASARIVWDGAAISISAYDRTNRAIVSVTRLSAGRYQVNCETNSAWDTTNTEVQVTPEGATGTPLFATVEPRVSERYVVVNMYTGAAPYGAQTDASFYIRINECSGSGAS